MVDLIINENRGYSGNIIDFGTGSGCIAIALALNIAGASVTGTDISEEALQAAGENARLNNAKITFVQDDILSSDTDGLEKAGLIVSNPPYVRNSEKALMNRNVLEFEPHSALFVTDSDPLIYYNSILKKSAKILCPPGKIYFEINEGLGESMVTLVESYGFRGIEIVEDMNGKERIIKGIRYA
jgi:release factor glutamine methyltransferase